MGYKPLSSILLVLVVLAVAGCNSSDSKQKVASRSQEPAGQIATTYADGIRRVTIQELEQLRGSGNVFIVDVRNQASFDQGHIPGAKLIPVGEVLTRINEFPRDKQVITYCS